jgi:hypothetical protein
MNPSDLVILIESTANLGDPDISIDDLDVTSIISGLDGPDNENEENGLGLNAFANNLPGGKKLRKRMRKLMADSVQNLKTDLKSTDPGGKYSSGIVR